MAADLVLIDEMHAVNRPERPLDPNWAPDVVLLDETAEAASGKTAETPDAYQSLFQQISARANPEKKETWEVKVLRVIGILVFVAMIVGTIWLCYVAWSFDPEVGGRDPQCHLVGSVESHVSCPQDLIVTFPCGVPLLDPMPSLVP